MHGSVSQGMCGLGKLYWPTVKESSQDAWLRYVVSTLSRRHYCMPMTGTFSQEVCASGKRHWQTTSDIDQIIFVMHCCICRGLCTLLSWYPTSTSHISHGLCTSLSFHKASPSCITLILHTAANQCWTWAARMRCSLHIAQQNFFVDCLHRLCLEKFKDIICLQKATLSAASTNQVSDVGQWEAASTKAYTRETCRLYVDGVTSE